ncbi:MAG: hypothetical protein J6U54_16805 [Clostridiales bacterium]|nr:hypothetical protein [Clostridiales bacterium]
MLVFLIIWAIKNVGDVFDCIRRMIDARRDRREQNARLDAMLDAMSDLNERLDHLEEEYDDGSEPYVLLGDE